MEIVNFIYLFGGLFLLFEGGNYLVKSGVALAKHFKVSDFLIAVIIVSMGTSFPELLVSVSAAIKHHPDISIGNVVGSNIANIALGIGIASLFFPVVLRRKAIYFDWTIMLIVSSLLIILSLDGTLSLIDGIIMLVIFIIYLSLSIRNDAHRELDIEDVKDIKPQFSLFVSFLILAISIFALWLGAEGVIEGASNIARGLGISERIISLTVVALGTSLPEIATSMIAFYHKKPEITVGNIIGSNIFNISLILGLTASIYPIKVNEKFFSTDYPMLIITTILLFPVINLLKRKTGIQIYSLLLLVIYGIYIFYLFY